MVNCQYKDEHGCRCKRNAYYGEEPGKPIFCGLHNENKWDNVMSPRCLHPNCNIFASCGPEGTRKLLYCGPHGKEKGMNDVKNSRCQHPECEKLANWGPEGTKEKRYCAQHGRDKGMVDVHRKRCDYPGCMTHPSFAFEGNHAKYCKIHAEEGMENVVSKRCVEEGCESISSYGLEGGPATYCGQHALPGMKDVAHKKCIIEGCETQPTFGFNEGPATHCGPHALPGMENVNAKKCVSCGLFIVTRAPHLCSYCTPNTSKRQKTREMTVKTLLEAATDLDNPIHDKPIGGECGKYRPDFLYDAATHFVVVEVDEDQHRSYDPECERVRMINIISALGMRCIFVRYNPDTFKIDGKTIKVFEKKRQDLLLRTVRECMKPSVDSQIIDVVYLYYDGVEIRTEML